MSPVDLKSLLENVGVVKISGKIDKCVSSVVSDSRNTVANSLFVSVKGVNVDGHLFVDSSINKGATVIVYENSNFVAKVNSKITYIKVNNTRKALALIASSYYHNVHRKMHLIGITGTNGKTTTCELTYQLLKKLNKKVGLISTVSAKSYNSNVDLDTGYHVTTPDALELHKIIAEMYKRGCEYLVIETTSHSLDQYRTWGLNFEICAITNVTPEHMDYHHTFNKYLQAKARIFSQSSNILLNSYDPSLNKILSKLPKNASFKIVDYNTLDYPIEFKDKFPGQYNLENLALAHSIVIQLTGSDTRKFFNDLQGVTGRFENISTDRGFKVIIDFAHDASSLENILKEAKKITQKKLILVFGCAGLRDKKKRPKMGELAAKLADKTVVTAEDPRTELLAKINKEIEAGLTKAGGVKDRDYFIIDDRKAAINFAVNDLADVGDLVLITGKGHEKSMCFGAVEVPWSDREVVEESLKVVD